MARKNTIEDFHTKYIKQSNGCWEWQRAKNRKGYGQFKYLGTLYIAHRFLLQIEGKIPDGYHVLHKCDNPSCVSPKHLWVGTNQENVDDKMSKGRHRFGSTSGYKNGKAIHCKHGHEYTEENTRIRKSDNSRQCRICERQRCKDYYWERGGKARRQEYDKQRRSLERR